MTAAAQRLKEYTELLIELQNRYRDVPGPQRAAFLITTVVGITDAFCFAKTGRHMTEDEFVSLFRTQYRRLKEE